MPGGLCGGTSDAKEIDDEVIEICNQVIKLDEISLSSKESNRVEPLGSKRCQQILDWIESDKH